MNKDIMNNEIDFSNRHFVDSLLGVILNASIVFSIVTILVYIIERK